MTSGAAIRKGAIAKWLRRQIRNLFLFEGAGSNPAGVARHFCVMRRPVRYSHLVFTHLPAAGATRAVLRFYIKQNAGTHVALPPFCSLTGLCP